MFDGWIVGESRGTGYPGSGNSGAEVARLRAGPGRRQVVQEEVQQHTAPVGRVGAQGVEDTDGFHGRQGHALRDGLSQRHPVGVQRSESAEFEQQLSHHGVSEENRAEDVSEHAELVEQADDSAVFGRTRVEGDVRDHSPEGFREHYHTHFRADQDRRRYVLRKI